MFSGLKSAPIPVVLLIASFLCPTEFSLEVGGLRLPPHRIALLVLFGFAVAQFFLRRDIHIRPFDIAFALFGLWAVSVFTIHEGAPKGLVYGGSLALESFGAYLIARVYIRDQVALRSTLQVMVLAIGVSALFALPDALFGQAFTHDILERLTGYHHPRRMETRLGLTRAYGTFDHPIHYGTFCAGLLALFWFNEMRGRNKRRKAALVSGATFLGLSSAPMLCLGVQGGLIVWERLSRGIKGRVALSFVALAGLYIGVALFSNRTPIMLIATGLTLDSWTGFYRVQIWTHGLENVWANPWIGLGLADWERPWWMVADTVDAFWLVVAMREGLPAFLLLASGIALLIRQVASNRRRHGDRRVESLAMGWMMSLAALCLVGATVHYWNVLHTFFFFFIGMGAWIADPKRRYAPGVQISDTTMGQDASVKRWAPNGLGLPGVPSRVGSGVGAPWPMSPRAGLRRGLMPANRPID